MKRPKRPPKVRPVEELLQEVQNRIGMEVISAYQQQSLTALVTNILASYVQAEEHLSPGKGIHAIPGQWHVKRALEVAAAGGHNILLVGPPKAGKAQLARTVSSLLPISSLSYPIFEPASSIEKRILGQTIVKELTAACGGVLFFKDLDTFDLSLLTDLSQMVQTQVITTQEPEGSVVHPTQFLLVATVKPCPCGFFGDLGGSCLCSTGEVEQYRERLKEVVHACFAIEIEVPLIEEEMVSLCPEDSSATIRQRVEIAREIQHRRYAETMYLRVNADLRSADEVQRYCQMAAPAQDLLKSALRQLHLTPLEALRVQAVARTVADLEGSPIIAGKPFAEAIRYLSGFIRDE